MTTTEKSLYWLLSLTPINEREIQMTTALKRFKYPYHTKVSEVVDKSYSIAFDGCHKIYVHKDLDSHNRAVGYGYEPILIRNSTYSGVKEAVDQLFDWFEDSCCLRFIQAVDGKENYESIIPLFALDDDDEYDYYDEEGYYPDV